MRATENEDPVVLLEYCGSHGVATDVETYAAVADDGALADVVNSRRPNSRSRSCVQVLKK